MNLGDLGPTCPTCGREADHPDPCPTPAPKAPDCVRAEDYDAAAKLLRQCAADVGPIAQQWLGHAYEHLAHKLDRYFRAEPPLRTEDQAKAVMRTYALYIRDAALALQASAERMKSKGDSVGASAAFRAYVRARDIGIEWLGDSGKGQR